MADENKDELELLKSFSKDILAHKDEIKKLDEKFEAEKTKQVEKATADGATIKQLEDTVKELNTKMGRTAIIQPSFAQKQNRKFSAALVQQEIHTLVKDQNAKLDTASRTSPIEFKVSNVTSATLSGGNYIDFLPTLEGLNPLGQTRVRDIFSTIPSQFDNVDFPQQTNPGTTGSAGYQVNELDVKDQIGIGLQMATLLLKPYAGFAVTSRQSLRNIPFLQSYLPIHLLETLQDNEDLTFGAALVAGATGSTTITSTSVYVEKLVYLVTNLLKKKFKPNFIAIDPAFWAAVILTKPNDYSLPGAVSIDASGNTRIIGIPVIPVNWLGAGGVLIGDSRKAAIVESESLSLRQSDSHDTYFVKNAITWLLERTEGLAVFNGGGFITTTFS